jgi:small-conductance mechanosensitive channel
MLSVVKTIYWRKIEWLNYEKLEKDVERSGRGLLWSIIPAFSWRNWLKLQVNSVTIVGDAAEIRIKHLSNTSRKRCHLSQQVSHLMILKYWLLTRYIFLNASLRIFITWIYDWRHKISIKGGWKNWELQSSLNTQSVMSFIVHFNVLCLHL